MQIWRATRMAGVGDEVVDPPLLESLPRPPAPPHDWDPPADNVRAQKAQLLANAALYDFAVAEMQAASPGSPPWEAKSVAEIYNEQGSYIRAIETLKRAVPGYFAADIPQIPRPVWEGLFPRPFWPELTRDAAANQLDPHIVASLIRQESEFNPSAISTANAMGLMQLLPSVGKGLAKQMKIKHFSPDELLVADTNLRLGTRYFRQMVDHLADRWNMRWLLTMRVKIAWTIGARTEILPTWKNLWSRFRLPKRGNTCRPSCATP